MNKLTNKILAVIGGSFLLASLILMIVARFRLDAILASI
ncbi:hypothetical protein L21SP2_2563 [Salinispira pacifica]|uniref:Uncharacterized protein n=1 Tax=Salinispira pacifica TaxID=1307761 RepID=V5WJT0_9SPIO|nr:hypothetical protein L21SP2_2563 [Salinispira pacifica]